MRLFHLQRDEDASGVSGIGRVAEGVVFTDGSVVLRWLTEKACTGMYRNLDDVIDIHGHQGRTRIVFRP